MLSSGLATNYSILLASAREKSPEQVLNLVTHTTSSLGWRSEKRNSGSSIKSYSGNNSWHSRSSWNLIFETQFMVITQFYWFWWGVGLPSKKSYPISSIIYEILPSWIITGILQISSSFMKVFLNFIPSPKYFMQLKWKNKPFVGNTSAISIPIKHGTWFSKLFLFFLSLFCVLFSFFWYLLIYVKLIFVWRISDW